MEALAKTRVLTTQQRHVIDDESKVGEARRAAQTLANFEFDAQTAGKVAIVATELANNLLRHAGGGELLIQTLGTDGAITLEILAIDKGPGMQDVSRCMTDGYSTIGTAGTGLGAARRLSEDFDIYSVHGEGTIIMARFGNGLATRFGAICLPMDGELDCGDAWHIVTQGDRTGIIVVDGLGHGTFAAEAAQAGIDAFAQSPWEPPQQIMLRAGSAMSKTRGGAAACAHIEGTRVSYSGIGNISGALISREKSLGLVSHAGTLGMQVRRAQQFEYDRPAGTLLVMHSDGLSARWSYKDRPDVFLHHPAIIAALLYRDHARERDDATVVVVG
ncbi:MAG TPA: ATP-binding SpoIIE family protein phosphatase [Steroidobacteraceae bacterium]